MGKFEAGRGDGAVTNYIPPNIRCGGAGGTRTPDFLRASNVPRVHRRPLTSFAVVYGAAYDPPVSSNNRGHPSRGAVTVAVMLEEAVHPSGRVGEKGERPLTERVVCPGGRWRRSSLARGGPLE